MRWPQKVLAQVISSPVLSTAQQRAEFDCLCQQPAELTFGREGVAASDFVSSALNVDAMICKQARVNSKNNCNCDSLQVPTRHLIPMRWPQKVLAQVISSPVL